MPASPIDYLQPANRDEIRVGVLKGLAFLPVEVNEGTVEKLIAKVIAAKPKNPKNFAFFVGKNYAIDQTRRIDVQRRAEISRVAAIRRAEREAPRLAAEAARAAAILQACKTELSAIVDRLARGPLKGRQLHQLHVLRLAFVHGESDAAIAARLPWTTPEQRWQWKTRALRLVLPHASPMLRKCLYNVKQARTSTYERYKRSRT